MKETQNVSHNQFFFNNLLLYIDKVINSATNGIAVIQCTIHTLQHRAFKHKGVIDQMKRKFTHTPTYMWYI